ncbi:MAG: hypothetical protein DRI61_09785 [Chloroflexi bacterium]|nr:MAG: hypothetical protein DRI61_09785 [Chloroflexota bacterium]
MIAIEAIFVGLILLFGVIGLSRGWVREAIATAGILLGMFVLNALTLPAEGGRVFILVSIVAGLTKRSPTDPRLVLLVKSITFGVITFFAYYGPTMVRGVAVTRQLLQRVRAGCQEAALGFIVGLLNGYLFAGNLWYFLHQAGYPLPPGLYSGQLSSTAEKLVGYLPPNFLHGLTLYGVFALLLLFIFVAVT